jgi:hypothetical protein
MKIMYILCVILFNVDYFWFSKIFLVLDDSLGFIKNIIPFENILIQLNLDWNVKKLC